MGGEGALGFLIVIAIILMLDGDSGSRRRSDVDIFEWLPMEDPNKSRGRRRR